MNIKDDASLGKCAIDYSYCNYFFSNYSRQVFLFNSNKYKRSFFSQSLLEKYLKYKIETKNQLWDKDKNYMVLFDISTV